MNRNTDLPEPGDEALRQALRQAASPAAQTEALQQRVLAQWRQRHAQPPVGPSMPLSQGPLMLLGLTRRQRWARALLLALGLALAAWWLRPDPALNELLQPDVLSQMALGEF